MYGCVHTGRCGCVRVCVNTHKCLYVQTMFACIAYGCMFGLYVCGVFEYIYLYMVHVGLYVCMFMSIHVCVLCRHLLRVGCVDMCY